MSRQDGGAGRTAPQVVTGESVEAVAKKAFQKAEGIKWDATTEHTRNKWRERYRHQMEAMARAERKKDAQAIPGKEMKA
jgi:hypothetical protein